MFDNTRLTRGPGSRQMTECAAEYFIKESGLGVRFKHAACGLVMGRNGNLKAIPLRTPKITEKGMKIPIHQ